jgi:Ala-tRNA(Pro) deacylase
MGIALTLREYLDDKHVDYDVMVHKRTQCAQDTARESHVPAERVAKAVVLTREGGFVLAVVPANSKVQLETIEKMLHCRVEMATALMSSPTST